MIADHKDWILAKIAQKLSEMLSPSLDVCVLYAVSSNFRKELYARVRKVDIVHFLSPWVFYDYKGVVSRPCVVTMWHMVDWSMFTPHVNRLDALYLSAKQWVEWSKPYVPKDVPVFRMPYGLDTHFFMKVPQAREDYKKQIKAPDQTVVIGFAGTGNAMPNQQDRKGHDRLFSLLGILNKKMSIPVVLRIVGKGWSRSLIPKDIRDWVQLDEFIREEDMPAYYSSLDVYLCLGKCEGVPYPVLEAMSCETPVITTPVGVAPEIIENGKNGFILSASYAAEDIMKNIEQLSANHDFRTECGRRARITIQDNFRWEDVVNAKTILNNYKQAERHFHQRSLTDRFGILTKWFLNHDAAVWIKRQVLKMRHNPIGMGQASA